MSPVRRLLGYLIAWVVASTVTAGVAWLGIRSVLVAAAPNRMSPLSAAELRNVAPRTAAAPVEPQPSPSPATPSPSPSPSDSPKASPSPSDTWQPVPDGKGGTGYRRTFRTSGGDVVVFA